MTGPADAGDLAPFPADRWPFEEVVDRLMARAERGEFTSRGRLPTARELMAHYNVGHGTVQHVWKVLIESGRAYYVRGLGHFLS
jgi:DNA-binding GntR family transcriptional regulator